jgi:predicted kinase
LANDRFADRPRLVGSYRGVYQGQTSGAPCSSPRQRAFQFRLPVMLIALSGLPGVGKTTIALHVARDLAAVYLRIDSIEQSLHRTGWPVEDEGYNVAHAIAEDNLRLGRIVVADCVNPWPLTRREWQAVAERSRVSAIDVEIVCSDAREHRRRVEARAADIVGHTMPTWEEVVERDYRMWDSERIVIDTSRLSVEQSVQMIIEKVLSEGASAANQPPRHSSS